MNYSGMPMGMWYLYEKSFRDKLVSVMGYDQVTADQAAAKAKWKYRSIIDKIPEFEKEDRFRMNIVSCAMLIAFTLNMPNRPSVEMLADYYEKSMMIKQAKAFFRVHNQSKLARVTCRITFCRNVLQSCEKEV